MMEGRKRWVLKTGFGLNDEGEMNGLTGRVRNGRVWVWVLVDGREKVKTVAVASMVVGIEKWWKLKMGWLGLSYRFVSLVTHQSHLDNRVFTMLFLFLFSLLFTKLNYNFPWLNSLQFSITRNKL